MKHSLLTLPLLLSATAPLTAQLTWAFGPGGGPGILETGMAFDKARGEGVMFGGLQFGVRQNSLWEVDANGWTQVFVATPPSARSRPTMAYFEPGNVTLMFGGQSSPTGFLNDTWSYNGTGWTRNFVTAPTSRSGAAMCYDSDRQVIVMYGGFVPSALDTNDTWEWNGVRWTRVFTANSPPNRGAHRMVYDRRRQKTVMFGGFSTPGGVTLGDTWEYDGANWTQVNTPVRPSDRCDQAMVYDEERGVTVLFGGLERFGPPPTFTPVVAGDLWTYDGQWSLKTNTQGGAPTPRAYPFAVYDSTNQRTVIHSGFDPLVTFTETRRLLTQDPTSFSAYGAGCGGANGVPELSTLPGENPWIGDSFTVEVTSAPLAATVGLMVVGYSNQVWNGQSIPVDLTSLGVNGCEAWLSVDEIRVMLLNNGSGTFSLNIPLDTNLVGFDFYLQTVIRDATSTRPRPLSISNALAGTIGNW